MRSPDYEQAFRAVRRQVPPRRLLRPLMSLIRSSDGAIKHRAVTGLGVVTAELAEKDLEAARDVVRRLMLTLTEESGGIGWGSPEAIGEILARHEGLAAEYADILLSYAEEGGENYLEHQPLQRGVLWGLGRLAQARPQLLVQKSVLTTLPTHLTSSDATVRAMAVWTLSRLGIAKDVPEWDRIMEDTAAVTVYLNGKLVECRVQDLARQAMHRQEVPGSRGYPAGSPQRPSFR